MIIYINSSTIIYRTIIIKIRLLNKNKFIIPPEFDEAMEFSEGLAAVRVGAEWVIEPRGNDGSGSPAEYVRVLTGGKWGYIFNPLP